MVMPFPLETRLFSCNFCTGSYFEGGCTVEHRACFWCGVLCGRACSTDTLLYDHCSTGQGPLCSAVLHRHTQL